MKVLSIQVPLNTIGKHTIRARILNTADRTMIGTHAKVDDPTFKGFMDWAADLWVKHSCEYVVINADGMGASYFDMLESRWPGRVYPA